MSRSLLKQAAARSAARMKERTSPPPPEAPSPAGEVKATLRGTKYRVRTVSLDDLPGLLAREGLEPKLFFHFKPEEDPRISDPEARYRSGFVLGVRKKGDKETKEL